jgi:hypothetical protein
MLHCTLSDWGIGS